ncbi:MAG: TetR/AcrR family transcriptional regulator [bacterium]|nr:TetR/AcrR family transcriptional regulator [bacterium]
MTDVESLLHQALSEQQAEPKNARDRSRVETRKRLMQAWRDLVTDRPPGSISVREIAAKAQVSTGAFYCHFKDKDALNGEVAVECLARLVSELDLMALEHVEPDTEARYRAVFNLLMDFAERHPSEATFMLRLAPSETDEGREFLSMWDAFWEQRVEEFAEHVLAGLNVDPDLNRAVLAQALYGMGEKLLKWWLANRGRVDRNTVVDTLARFVAKGLA